MKTIFLLHAVLLLTCTTLHSQNYIPFPTDNAQWGMCQVYNVMTGGSNAYYYWQQYFAGDTVIDGVTYHKIYMKKLCKRRTYGANEPQGGQVFFTDFQVQTALIGGLREEAKKIYFRKFDLPPNFYQSYYETVLNNMPANQEGLLYDFNWQLNDTFALGFSTKKFKVETIEMINARRHYTLRHLTGFGYTIELIEGMGHTGGLLGIYYDPTNIPLLPACVTQGVNVVQASNYCDDCPAVASTYEDDIPGLHLAPNPSYDHVCIETGTENETFNLFVWNLQGQLVRRLDNLMSGYCLDWADFPCAQAVVLAVEVTARGRAIRKVIRQQ